MSSEHEAAVARPLIDRAREVRVIRALYLQESLSQPTQSSNSEAVAAVQTIARTYQNTGIQTLPPANGSVFRLIHGREPSHYDYARSMGSAGIGRLTNDTRKNPFEVFFGAAYIAPTAVRNEKHTHSGFQTVSHAMRIKALASAKVRASMMANRYRNAAFKAGYIIGAESQDEMVVHSEQVPSAVRLDTEGNLLEGDVRSRGLPNIYGALVHDQPSQATVPRTKPIRHAVDLAKEPIDGVHGVQTSQTPYPFPSDLSRMPSQQSTAELRDVPKSVPALASAYTGQSISTLSVIDDEYGSWGPVTDEFVVFDAGAELNAPVDTHDSRKKSQGKRKAGMRNTDNQLYKKLKSSAQVELHNSPVSLAPLPVIYPSNFDQDRSGLPVTPDADVKPSPSPSSALILQQEDLAQDRVMSLIETGTSSRAISKNDQSSKTDLSRQLESRYRHQTLRGQLDRDRGVYTRLEASKLYKTGDGSHTSPAISNSSSARLTGDTLEPIVVPAMAETRRDGLDAQPLRRALRRSKRSFEEINPKFVDGEQVRNPDKNIVGEYDHRKGTVGHKIAPTNEMQSLAD